MPVDVLNPDIAPVPMDQATPGPRLGFLDSFAANYDEQARDQSMFGLQKAFADADDENAAAATKAGVDYTPLHAMPLQDADFKSTGYVGDTTDADTAPTTGRGVYRGIAQALVDKQDNYSSPQMREQDARINDLNLKTPGLALKSMSQLFDSVRQRASDAERTASFPKTLGGDVGGFLGGAIASMDPRTDPLNTATLAVGGAGETALARIGIQAGSQGLAQAINELTGVQENRRLLGLSHSDTEALASVAMAAVGGAALQGIGEAGAAALRKATTGKWFADLPHDPAPPLPPKEPPPPAAAIAPVPPLPDRAYANSAEDLADLLNTRQGYPRALGDLDYTTQQLSKWGADEPWKIPPPTDTSIPGQAPEITSRVDLSAYTGVESKDSIARRIDPETFGTYDKLAAQVNDLRTQLAAPELAAGADEAASRNTIRDQITQVEASIQNARGSKLRKLTQQLEDLKGSVDPTVNTVQADDLRSQLITADQHMRDLAPAVTRAYALADKKWTAYNSQKAQIDAMMTEARPAIGENLPVVPGAKDIGPPPIDLERRSPAQHVPEMEGTVPPKDEPMVHTVQRVQEAAKKQADDATATFQAEVPKILDPPELKDAKGEVIPQDKNILTLKDSSGNDLQLHLDDDKLVTMDEDGRVVTRSVREMLEETQKDNEMMKAIGSCSLPGTS